MRSENNFLRILSLPLELALPENSDCVRPTSGFYAGPRFHNSGLHIITEADRSSNTLLLPSVLIGSSLLRHSFLCDSFLESRLDSAGPERVFFVLLISVLVVLVLSSSTGFGFSFEAQELSSESFFFLFGIGVFDYLLLLLLEVLKARWSDSCCCCSAASFGFDLGFPVEAEGFALEALGEVGDHQTGEVLDSWVFVEAGSFDSEEMGDLFFSGVKGYSEAPVDVEAVTDENLDDQAFRYIWLSMNSPNHQCENDLLDLRRRRIGAASQRLSTAPREGPKNSARPSA